MDARDINLPLLLRLNAEDSLAEFCRQGWPILEPITRLDWNWHHDLICEYLEGVASGEIQRLIINVAPRSMKSILVSVMYPVWTWCKQPSQRFMCASYSGLLATKHSRDRRGILLSPWYARNWRVRLKDDANRADDFANEGGGHMSAVSVGGSVTGRGAMCIIVDDLVSPMQADSESERSTAIRFFDETLSSRLDDKRRGAFVVVEQRTHQGDLTGHLLEQGGWVHVSLPAIAERAVAITFPRSGRIVARNIGDYLWPSHEGKAELDAARVRLGAHAFNCQYQQAPVARGGNLIKRDALRFYNVAPRHLDRIVMSVDCAYGTAKTNDYSALVVIGELRQRGADGSAPGFYLLTGWRDRCVFSALKEAVVNVAGLYRPVEALLIEKAASGMSLAQELRANTTLPVREIRVDTDKYSRVAAIEPTISAGLFYLPANGGAWVEDYTSELCGFPSWAHDDWTDATTMAINYLRHQQQAHVTVRELQIGGGGVLFDSAARGDSAYHRPDNAGGVITTLGGARFISPDEPEPAPVPSSGRIDVLPGYEPGGMMRRGR